MNRLTPICIEWSAWNGFTLSIFEVETNTIDNKSLFSIYFCSNFFYFEVAFKIIKIFDKTDEY
jgi:hypothetical protein